MQLIPSSALEEQTKMTTRRQRQEREETPEPGPVYEPPDDLDIEGIRGILEPEDVYTPKTRSEEEIPPPRKRQRNIPLEQPRGPRRDTTTSLLREIRDNIEALREEARTTWEKNENEWKQAKKERDTLLRNQERLTALLHECQNRLGVVETRILALQEARKDKAMQITPTTASTHTETPHIEPTEEGAKASSGMGFTW